MSAMTICGAVTWLGSAVAVALTAHTAVNVRLLRRPTAPRQPVAERVSILLPVRDEATNVRACLERLLAQRRLDDVEILVLDDQSTDATIRVAQHAAGDDRRVRILDGTAPPPGWLGKPHACRQLADAATGDVLVFVDADVRLEPDAVAATVTQLRDLGLHLVCPYPRQEAVTWAERLVQPLLQWSWLTTLPLRLAETTSNPALGAANGQLLAVDTATYHRCGGHAGIRTEVLDDLALLRAVKAVGGHGVVTDGTALASCRMYTGWNELREGYGKSLWSAFGSARGAASVLTILGSAYVVPAAAALTGSRVGLVGYAAGVAGRVLTGRRTGARAWPDAFAHPGSITLLVYLTVRSFAARRRGTATWKGRSVAPGRRP